MYPILLLLLLLSNCSRGCGREGLTGSGDDTLPAGSTTVTEPPADSHNSEEPAEEELVEAARHTGRSGNLKVTLLWDFQGDIDLHMMQPNGNELFFRNKKDRSTGGFLDVDNQAGGPGSAENMFWETPPPGEYTIALHYYQPSAATGVAEAGTCSVIVFKQGEEPRTYRVPMQRVNESVIVTKLNIH